MEVRITYKGSLHGKRGLWCGFKPEGLEVEEEIKILYPKEDYDLEHKITKERFSSIVLGKTSQEDYNEVPHEEQPIVD